MASNMKKRTKTTPPQCVSVYFRGCVSENDNRQIIIGAIINHKPDTLSKKIMLLNCKVDGNSVIYYNAERDNRPASEVNKIYRSLLDGTYAL